MRYRLLWVALLCLAIVAAIGIAYPLDRPDLRGPVVKLLVNGGHGSGVHIGDGYILSAAHVVQGGITAKLDDETEIEAETLWVNEAYDIALLRLKDSSRVASVNLACRVPEINEPITARGNPLRMEWITTRGWIAGAPLSVPLAWKSVLPMSIPLAGGMSGGGLFDRAGNLVGILVGAPLQRIGFGASFVGITYAVDGKTICNLLARS